MKVRLHHLRSAMRSTWSLQGLICAPLLAGFAALVVVIANQHDRPWLNLPFVFVWSAALSFIAAVAMSTSQHEVTWSVGGAAERGGGRLPHPALPLSPRWRAALSAIAWLPLWLLTVAAWAVVQKAGYTAGPSLLEVLSAGALIGPALVVFGFDRRVTHLRFLRAVAPLAALVMLASMAGGLESPARIALTGAVLSLVALIGGDRVAALSLAERAGALRGRVQALRLEPLPPSAALRRQVIGGIARSLRQALPWIAFPTVAALAALHWVYVAFPPASGTQLPEMHLLAPVVGAGLGLWVGSAGFLPLGTRLSLASESDLVSAWRGPWARHWALLPVSRRQLFHATYWPMLSTTLLALVLLVGWHFLVPSYALSFGSHPWVLPIGAAYAGALTAVNCAGLLGQRRPFHVSMLLAAGSLASLCGGVLLDASALRLLSGALAALLALFIPPWLWATSERPLLDAL